MITEEESAGRKALSLIQLNKLQEIGLLHFLRAAFRFADEDGKFNSAALCAAEARNRYFLSGSRALR